MILTLLPAKLAHADKIRDLCDIVGARENQLVGYGIITGLNGTGDDVSAPFAAQSLRSLLRRLGVQLEAKQVRLRNIAAVAVTTNIPAFARPGSHLDVTISSIGNAKSLRGGVLIQTPLRGADRKTYAVAQGPLVLGGFSASGASGSSVQENITTTARLPNGALVEREIKTAFTEKGKVTLSLRNPDFATAQHIAQAIDQALGKGSASALDAGAIVVTPQSELQGKPVEFIAKLGDIEADPVLSARIVINERTGTIVAGGDVRLSPVAIAQGGISITVRETKSVSQPNPFSPGQTREVQTSEVEAQEKTPAPAMNYMNGGTTLAEVASALATLGVSPRELASILQGLKSAGALRAEIVMQ